MFNVEFYENNHVLPVEFLSAIVVSHEGEYAPLIHFHDERYSQLDHNHDGVYSPVDHNHDGVYSPVNHNHDGVYQPVGDYLTEADLDGYATQDWVNDQGFLTEHQSLTDYYTKAETVAQIDEAVPQISVDIEADATSDTKTVSPKAVKTYVDNNIPQVPVEVTIGATPSSETKIFIDTAAHFGDYLYNEGNEYPNITGGWELLSFERDDISFSKEASYLSFVRNGGSSFTSKIRIVTNKKIDLTNLNKLKLYATSTRTDRSAVDVYINTAKSDANMINLVHSTDFPTPIIADVSDYTGEYYVIYEFSAWMSSCESQLTVVELEFNADTPAETLKYLINGEYVAMDYARRADIEAVRDYVDSAIGELDELIGSGEIT